MSPADLCRCGHPRSKHGQFGCYTALTSCGCVQFEIQVVNPMEAAAPRMLAALKAARDFIKPLRSAGRGLVLDAINDAIAKATGGGQ